jgi:hypothetical protein
LRAISQAPTPVTVALVTAWGTNAAGRSRETP